MNKFTEEQIEKIKSTHAEVCDLQKTQDKLFEKLIKDLEFEDYSNAWQEDSDCYIFKDDNPANWLFDTIFNTASDELDDSIKTMEKHWGMYDQRD
jgi:hypothetical protein